MCGLGSNKESERGSEKSLLFSFSSGLLPVRSYSRSRLGPAAPFSAVSTLNSTRPKQSRPGGMRSWKPKPKRQKLGSWIPNQGRALSLLLIASAAIGYSGCGTTANDAAPLVAIELLNIPPLQNAEPDWSAGVVTPAGTCYPRPEDDYLTLWAEDITGALSRAQDVLTEQHALSVDAVELQQERDTAHAAVRLRVASAEKWAPWERALILAGTFTGGAFFGALFVFIGSK